MISFHDQAELLGEQLTAVITNARRNVRGSLCENFALRDLDAIDAQLFEWRRSALEVLRDVDAQIAATEAMRALHGK